MPTLIPLSRGMFATVDDADAEWLGQWKWSTLATKSGKFYAMRGPGILMHRLITQAPKGMDVDHWPDADGLNNQRGNLRVATRCGNSQNRKMHRNNSTGYKGVSRQGRKFIAQICASRTPTYLGTFDTAEEAYAAYVAAALELHGDFARLA